MKNIQVIDGAENCVYDIFSASDALFQKIYPPGENIAFIDEVLRRNRRNRKLLDTGFRQMWSKPVAKNKAVGIDGILFYQLEKKKPFYPTRRDEEAVNPDGTPLRQRRA